MNIFKTTIITLLALGLTGKVFSQSNWIGIMPMQHLPSFAGSEGKHRLNINSAITFSDNSNNVSNTSSLSYDVFIKKISTGIGVVANQIFHYVPGTFGQWGTRGETNRTWSTSLIVAPKISWKGKYTLSPGFQFTYTNTTFVLRYFINEGLDSMFGIEHIEEGFHPSYSASLLFNSPKFYSGIAFASPGFYPIENLRSYSTQNLYYSSHWSILFQTGYTFEKINSKDLAITPQVLLYIPLQSREYVYLDHLNEPLQDKSIYYKASVNIRYKKFISGIGNTGLLLGYQNKNFRLVSIFNFDQDNGLESELAMKLAFGKKK